MLRPFASRFFAGLLALTAAFAAPVSAFAHGYAHHDEAAGTVDYDHHSPERHLVIAEGSDHLPGSHSHSIVSPALVVKTVSTFVAVSALRVELPPVLTIELVPPQPADVTTEPCDSLAHAPPPGLRAPPILIG